MPSSKTPSAARFARIRKVAESAPTQNKSLGLPVDSLANSLVLSAQIIAAVRAGKSLTEALIPLAKEPSVAHAAAQDIAYGVLRRYAWGEFILGQLLSKALSHLPTHALLLAALYRLETRPDAAHTVVDQAVLASSELAGGVFKGLVNGVLRSYLRQRDALLVKLKSNDEAQYQHPAWWLARLRRAYPSQTEQAEDWQTIVATGNAHPPMSLRVNQRRTTQTDYLERLKSVGLLAQAHGAQGLKLASPVPVSVLPGFAEGLVSVQDIGAQMAAEWLAPKIGARVLDACAAPGGKTAHLLEQSDIDLLALDIDPMRVHRIGQNLNRLGLCAQVKTADCRATDTWWDGNHFDAILADVPCSASGVVRRHPDIKYLRRQSDIQNFVRIQADILDALWPLLMPGGRLLYATCSVFPEENKAQIDAFLVRHSKVERLREVQLLPKAEHDGFYYALLGKEQ
ncbi:MAG: 16S rRNA (cytosine(967)-C(5))-methyltransferase RsmB [Pseudomonadota bacterium]